MTDQVLTEAQVADFRCIAGMIIPASAEYGVPGADDAVIFADILASIGRDFGEISAALAQAVELAGGAVVALDVERRAVVAGRLQAEGGAGMAVLVRVVLLCYYRDDRVMVSLGLEPRAPFPKGHVLEQGDWSLLDQVKARKPFWRAAS